MQTPVHPDWRRLLFRVWVAVHVIASVWVARTLFEGTFLPIVLSAALFVVRPRVGFLLYCCCAALSVAVQPESLQPQFVSFALAMPAGFAGRGGRFVLLAHLAALWFYAGAWKLSSPVFLSSDSFSLAPFGLVEVWGPAPGNLVVAAVEMALGVCVFGFVFMANNTQLMQRIILLVGSLLHLAIFGLLVHWNWNQGVWNWNLFLVGAIWWTLAPQSGLANVARAAPWTEGRAFRGLAVGILIYPMFYSVGLADPYSSWNLYSQSTPLAWICLGEPSPDEGRAAGRPTLSTLSTLPTRPARCGAFRPQAAGGIPVPPLHFLLVRSFQKACRPGEVLLRSEPRAALRKLYGSPGPVPCYRAR